MEVYADLGLGDSLCPVDVVDRGLSGIGTRLAVLMVDRSGNAGGPMLPMLIDREDEEDGIAAGREIDDLMVSRCRCVSLDSLGGAGFGPRVGRISFASSRTRTASSCLLNLSTTSRTPNIDIAERSA